MVILGMGGVEELRRAPEGAEPFAESKMGGNILLKQKSGGDSSEPPTAKGQERIFSSWKYKEPLPLQTTLIISTLLPPISYLQDFVLLAF